MLLEGMGEGLSLGPEIRGKDSIDVSHGIEGSLEEVLSGLSLSLRLGEAIVDSSELKEFLGGGSTDDTGSSGSGDESHYDGSGLSSGLARNSVGLTDLVTPIPSSDRDDVLLGDLETLSNGDLDLLCTLDSNSDMSVLVSDCEDSLESCSLSSLGLLLDRGNLDNFINEVGSDELINDLVLLDGERVGEDFLKSLNLS